MACYHPIPATQEGPEVTLWPPLGTASLHLPCGACIGCRTARATTWANRCTHEASLWPRNSFITLTYDDENLPREGHLRPTDLTLFLKRLRKYADSHRSTINRASGSGIRFFACGEYGEHTGRPHFHALLFNCGFNDTARVGKDLYESEALRRLWPYGQHRLGQASPAAAAYIAQYNLKKQGQGDHDADGVWRPAPFLRMSLRPAVGLEWLRKYRDDLSHGYLVSNGRPGAIPRYYRDKLKELDPAYAEEIAGRQSRHQLQNPGDQMHPERLKAAETMHRRRKELKDRRGM